MCDRAQGQRRARAQRPRRGEREEAKIKWERREGQRAMERSCERGEGGGGGKRRGGGLGGERSGRLALVGGGCPTGSRGRHTPPKNGTSYSVSLSLPCPLLRMTRPCPRRAVRRCTGQFTKDCILISPSRRRLGPLLPISPGWIRGREGRTAGSAAERCRGRLLETRGQPMSSLRPRPPASPWPTHAAEETARMMPSSSSSSPSCLGGMSAPPSVEPWHQRSSRHDGTYQIIQYLRVGYLQRPPTSRQRPAATAGHAHASSRERV